MDAALVKTIIRLETTLGTAEAEVAQLRQQVATQAAALNQLCDLCGLTGDQRVMGVLIARVREAVVAQAVVAQATPTEPAADAPS